MFWRKPILCLRRRLSDKSLTPYLCFYVSCCLLFLVLFILYGQYLWVHGQQEIQNAEIRGTLKVENSNQLNVLRVASSIEAVTAHVKLKYDNNSHDPAAAVFVQGDDHSTVKEGVRVISVESTLITRNNASESSRPAPSTQGVFVQDANDSFVKKEGVKVIPVDAKAATTITTGNVSESTIQSVSTQGVLALEDNDSSGVKVVSVNDQAATSPITTGNVSESTKSPTEEGVKVLNSQTTATTTTEGTTMKDPNLVKKTRNVGITDSFDSILRTTGSPVIDVQARAARELQERRARMQQAVVEKQRVATMLQKLNVTGTRALIERLQNKFDDKELISVRGFYSSGTNWLRSLLLHNCKNMTFELSMHPPMEMDAKLDADAVYGWKHGLFLEREITRLSSRKKQKLVIISREAPTWVFGAWKMYAMVNTPDSKRRALPPQPNSAKSATGAFGNIMRYINEHKVRESGIYSRYLGLYYDTEYRNQYRIDTDNVLEARTTVYRNWVSLLRNESISNQVYFIRYEDLLLDPYSVFRQLIQSLNVTNCRITSEDKFDPVNSYVKYRVEYNKNSFKGRHPKKEFCVAVKSQAIYEAILTKIDRAFDAEVLGYTYPDTLEEYCNGVVPPAHGLSNSTATINK